MPEKKVQRKRLPPHPAVWWSRLKLKWPVLVWIGAVALAWFLFTRGGEAQPLTGVVDVIRESVAPLETSRLLAVHVVAGDTVRAGDVLAEMDTLLLDAEMAFERLEVQRLFKRSVLTARTELHTARTQQARDEAEFQALNSELARFEDLLERNLIDGQLVAQLRVQRQALARAVELHPDTVSFLEQQVEETEALRRDAETTFGVETPVESGEAPTTGSRLGLLKQRRDMYILRAGQSGTISRIEKEPGEVVQAGEPILSLVVARSQFVIGFLPESNAHDLEVGRKVVLRSPLGDRREIPATVNSLGPEILALPGRVSPVPGQTMRGRRIVILPKHPDAFLPGESVSIHIAEPWWKELWQDKDIGDPVDREKAVNP
jgi:multidrug resistance efflux pump